MTISYVNMAPLNRPVERCAAFKRELLQQLEQTPGVRSVAETSVIPLSGGASDNDVWSDDAGESRRAASYFMTTSGGYFKTMEIPLLAGRGFDDERDTPESPRVAVVNQAWRARRPPTAATRAAVSARRSAPRLAARPETVALRFE